MTRLNLNATAHAGISGPAGFTLLELLLAVMLLAILATVAYPSYISYVISTQRTIATGALMEIAARQEQYFFDNKRYAADLQTLGFATSTRVNLDKNGSQTSASKSIYTVSIEEPVASCPLSECFSLLAEPKSMQTQDMACGSFMLDSSGARSVTGSRPERCW